VVQSGADADKAGGHRALCVNVHRLLDGSKLNAGAILAIATSSCFLILIAGCQKPELAHPNWFVESYDRGVITVHHDGKTYTATCDTSRSFNNAPSITDEKNVVVFPSCDLAMGLVGTNIQPLEGKQQSPDGRITVMWNVDATLAIRSSRDGRTPWRQDEFRITSVVAKE